MQYNEIVALNGLHGVKCEEIKVLDNQLKVNKSTIESLRAKDAENESKFDQIQQLILDMGAKHQSDMAAIRVNYEADFAAFRVKHDYDIAAMTEKYDSAMTALREKHASDIIDLQDDVNSLMKLNILLK